MSANENLVVKLFNSYMSQLGNIDSKIDRLYGRIDKIDDRVTTLENANEDAQALKTELKMDILEIKALWSTYRKYLIAIAIFSFSVGMLALGFDKSMELLGKLFKALF